MGPYFAGIFDPRSWASTVGSVDITLEVMRIVLATGLFAIGVELPKSYMAKHAKGLAIMVVPTMAIGWGIVAGTQFLFKQHLNFTGLLLGLLRLLFPQLDFISCLAVSACLTPTDPIICSAIVGKFSLVFNNIAVINMSWYKGGKFAQQHVPLNLRHILSAESAANDGLAYPFLTLAIYLTIESSRGVAITQWILIGCLCASFIVSLQH